MSELKPLDVVRLRSGFPEHGVPAGARAVVLEIHTEPYLAYEVEVVDEVGRTTFIGSVEAVQLDREWSSDEEGDGTDETAG